MDIVGSTALKDRPITEWAAWFHNSFINAICCLGWHNDPLKIIGDCLMFYLPELEPNEEGGRALSLFTGVYKLAAEPDDRVYRDVKLSVSFCTEAFELSFEKDRPDIYGKDIDLTHRLLELAGPRQVLMNAEFVKRVREAYARQGDKDPWREVERIAGPWPERIKGFAEPIPIYKVVAPCLPPGRWES